MTEPRLSHYLRSTVNDVAGEFLLPTEELRQVDLDTSAGIDGTAAHVSDLAGRCNLSNSMVAYRLYQVHVIDHETWRLLSATFRDLWLNQRESRRRQARQQTGGPNFYVVKRHRVGSALLDFTGRMLDAGALTTSKAAKVLGVKAKHRKEHDLTATGFALGVGMSETAVKGIVNEDWTRFAEPTRDKLLRVLGRPPGPVECEPQRRPD